MTNKEIQSLLDIPTSTMSDWERSPKREKLAKLLKNIDINLAESLLIIEDTSPKYSAKTQKIKLNKKLFTKDILWAYEDGSEVAIKTLISAFFNIPNEEDTAKLIKLFGEKRVRGILKKNKPIILENDFKEIEEQILYVTSPGEYYKKYELPSLDEILHNPKQRHIDKLMQVYSEDELLEIAKSKSVSLTTLLQIKKFLMK